MNEPLLCDRCGKRLAPGQGSFYHVAIETRVDDSPPEFSSEQPSSPTQWREIVQALEDLPAVEAEQDVHFESRYLLCYRCHRQWIEFPFGA